MKFLPQLLVLLHTAGIVSGVNIFQDPEILFIKPQTDSAILYCVHDGSNHFYMYWYKQGSDGEMRLFAFSLNKGAAEIVAPFGESKYTLDRPKVQNSSVQIHSVEAGDTAVYYCASSTTQ
uniref:Ig-like domain-containing protein n=1 Tax=Denticeps clupeoides TaxID=299321 RepID=A0AAY4AIX8_9TELE